MDVIKQLWIDTRNYDGGKIEFLSDIYSLLTDVSVLVVTVASMALSTVKSAEFILTCF